MCNRKYYTVTYFLLTGHIPTKMNFIGRIPSFYFLELKTVATIARPFNNSACHYSFMKKTIICTKQPLKRNFYTWFARRSTATLKKNDKIPEEYKLIYRTTFDKYLVIGQWLTTSMVAILGYCVVVDEDVIDIKSYDQFENKPRTTKNEAYIYLTTFIAFIIALHLMITRIPVRIYNHADSRCYIFVFHGHLPLSKKHVTCTVNELTKVEEKGILPWRDCRYKIIREGRTENDVLLFDYYFRKPSDLNVLLGYEKDYFDRSK